MIFNKINPILNMNDITNKIEKIIEQAKHNAYTTINRIMVETYFQIGKEIIEYEQNGKYRANYGENLIKKLSEKLTQKYGKGFSQRNLRSFRQFYLSFPKWQSVPAKLSWTHITIILRIDEPLKREFYIIQSQKENWSYRELERQINSSVFERFALSKNKSEVLKLSKNGQIIEKPLDLIKDPYVLEFLNLEENHKYTEKKFEQKIIDNLQKFILELGNGFMFVARQQRITLDAEHFYIDLVFYNRILKCFVIIELKNEKLKHEHLGQLQMYINYYDREIKSKEENLTIGILLCVDKKESIIKYTLPEDNKQIFASKYKLYLPDKKQLQKEIKKLIN